jgi:hypothetical protein
MVCPYQLGCSNVAQLPAHIRQKHPKTLLGVSRWVFVEGLVDMRCVAFFDNDKNFRLREDFVGKEVFVVAGETIHM